MLEDLFAEHGYYIDDQLSFVFEGAAGADRIASVSYTHLDVYKRQI